MENEIWDDVDPSAQEAQALSLPITFWLNGNSKLKAAGGIAYTGGLFLTDEAVGRKAEIKGWERASFVGSGGEDVTGIAASQAYVAIVRTRKRWFKEENQRLVFRPWASYAEGFRGQMQAVGFIRGLDEPVCFTFKGNVMKNMIAVLNEHARKLVAIVNRQTPAGKSPLPPYAVWMPVRSGPHEKVGQGNQTSEVTLPQISLPASIAEEWVRERVVTREQLRAMQTLFKEAEVWSREWDTGGDDAKPEQMKAQAVSASADINDPHGEYAPEWDGPAADSDIPF